MRIGLLGEIILPVIFVFFMANTMHGMMFSNTGYGALSKLEQNHAQVVRQLDELQRQRLWMEHRADLMNSDQIDPDMVDERIRDVLGYASPQDIVINRKDLLQVARLIQSPTDDTDSPAFESSMYDTVAMTDTIKPGSASNMGIIAVTSQ